MKNDDLTAFFIYYFLKIIFFISRPRCYVPAWLSGKECRWRDADSLGGIILVSARSHAIIRKIIPPHVAKERIWWGGSKKMGTFATSKQRDFFMPRTHEIDMLHGPLTGKIVKFAMPFAASSILQQLFNTVDVAVVGRFASSEALAAVGANTFLINLMINLFVGISVGASVIIAKHIGQRDTRRIREAVATTAALALFSGAFLLVVGMAAARPVLGWMGTPHNVIEDAILYLRIYFMGAPFFMVYNFGASILRSRGDT